MMRYREGMNIRIFADFYLLLASMILLLPLRWVIGFYVAAAVHEVCHGAAMVALGGSISELSLRAGGIYMAGECEGAWKRIICSAAGPLGALVCLLFLKWFPEISVCALVQSMYNLLPLWPLDGGRILRMVLEEICPYKVQRIERILRMNFAVLGFIAAVWCAVFFRMGGLLLALGISVLVKSVKTPCKPGEKRIQ